MRLLEFVLSNSFSTYDGCHYKQVFGCAMESPNSVTIANLVIEHVEETASNSSPPTRWWFKYVGESHACLQKQHMQEFHAALYAANPHIQFTIETEENNRLPFLDTPTTRRNGRVQVQVYRKTTHNKNYLDFGSHHPSNHKQSVVNSLLDRADKIPSTEAGKRKERKHVLQVLADNNYRRGFIKK